MGPNAQREAALSSIYQARRAEAAERRRVLMARLAELHKFEDEHGRSEKTEIDRAYLETQIKENDAYSVHVEPVHKVSIAHKAWLVFKPLVIWPLLGAGISFGALFLIMLVLRYAVSENASNGAMLMGSTAAMMIGGLAGMAGTIVAIIRLCSTRESLFRQLPPKQKAGIIARANRS